MKLGPGVHLGSYYILAGDVHLFHDTCRSGLRLGSCYVWVLGSFVLNQGFGTFGFMKHLGIACIWVRVLSSASCYI